MADREKMMQYLSIANPIIERLTIDLLIHRPSDMIEFIHAWLDTKGITILGGGQ